MNAHRSIPWLAAATLAAVLTSGLEAGGAVVFRGIGDLPGGLTYSEVRDATRAGGVLYAVGSSAANPDSTSGDTAVLWSSASGLAALPNLVENRTGSTFVTASALTPDAATIAGRSRSVAVGGFRVATRTARVGMAVQNLATLAGLTGNSAAVALSADGNVLYGMTLGENHAYRFVVAPPGAAAIPVLDGSDTGNLIAGRGCSADGSVAVGHCVNPSGNRAFRFVAGQGVAPIPKPPGGTWSEALAVSPDGRWALVRGNSSALPKGETDVFDASTGRLIRLGTPAEGWTPHNSGGISSDGTVVLSSYAHPTVEGPTVSYVRNARGWFQLKSILAAGGVDLEALGWEWVTGNGMSADGTLVYGVGFHAGHTEGFVAEFPPGFLAEFGAPPPAPENPSIVGTWKTESDDWVLIFLPDGTYVFIGNATPEEIAGGGSSGMERGTYSWNPESGELTIVTQQDTNGNLGLSELNGVRGFTFKPSRDTALVHLPGEGDVTTMRLGNVADSLSGGWNINTGTRGDNLQVAVFLPNGVYLYAQACNPRVPLDEMELVNGMERGAYTWNPATGAFAVQTEVDTTGDEGISSIGAGSRVQLNSGGNGFAFTDGTDSAGGSLVNDVRLTVKSTGTGLVLSWPGYLTGFTVQVSGAPSGPTWENVSGQPTSEAGLFRLSVEPTESPRWYRLFRAP